MREQEGKTPESWRGRGDFERAKCAVNGAEAKQEKTAGRGYTAGPKVDFTWVVREYLLLP